MWSAEMSEISQLLLGKSNLLVCCVGVEVGTGEWWGWYWKDVGIQINKCVIVFEQMLESIKILIEHFLNLASKYFQI